MCDVADPVCVADDGWGIRLHLLEFNITVIRAACGEVQSEAIRLVPCRTITCRRGCKMLRRPCCDRRFIGTLLHHPSRFAIGGIRVDMEIGNAALQLFRLRRELF